MHPAPIAWLAIVFLALTACTPREEREREAREDALAAYASGNQAEALEALERLRSVQPDTAEAALEYATLLVSVGEAPEAVWVLEDAVRRFDEDHELRLALATTLLLVSDAARARDVTTKIPADAPQHARALMIRAQAELKLGDLDAAFATLREAETNYPDQPGVRLPRISALLDERRFEEAHEAIREARDATEDATTLRILRRLQANLYAGEAREADTAEAKTDEVRALLEEDRGDPELWRTYAQLMFRQRRHADVRDDIVAELDEHPERADLYTLLATIQNSLGEGEAAQQTLRRWIDQQPSPSAYTALASIHVAQSDPDAALAVLDEGIAAVERGESLEMARAETLLAAGRLDETEAALDSLDESNADARHVELLRARLALERGDAEDARRRLEALVPELDSAVTQYWLGRALEATGDLAGAERRYGISITRDPNEPAGAYAAYALASARGDWLTAGSYAQLAASRAPGRLEGWYALLEALIQFGDAEKAVEVAESGRRFFPEDPTLIALHAAALRDAGRAAESAELTASARESQPDATVLAGEHAMALAAAGDVVAGLAILRDALEEAPDDPALLYANATLLYQAGRVDEGDATVDRALALDAENLRPLRRRLEFRAATGRLEEARRDAERYLAERPDDAGAHYIAGVVHDQLADEEAAVAAYRRAAELDASAVAPRNNLADLLGRMDRLDEAIDIAQQAFRLDPENPYVLDTLGYLYLRRGRVERSISLLEQARDAAPGLHAARLHLGLAYREAGRREEAREVLAALRSEAPESMHAEVDEALSTL